MFALPIVAALCASLGWAIAMVLSQSPAKQLGAFEFTRIQIVACSAFLAVCCSLLGSWASIRWEFWPNYVASVSIGIVLGNLALTECLRRGGPRRTELLFALKAPLVGIMAFFWFGELPTVSDAVGAFVTLSGVVLAVSFAANTHSESDITEGCLATVVILGVAATACQGFGFLVMKPAMLAGTDPLAASAIRLLGGALLISVIALWPARSLQAHSTVTLGLLGHTVLPGFISYGAASSLLLFAFANYDASIAAVLGSLSPILILPILWVKEGVAPSPLATFGALLAVAGTAVILIL